MDTTYSCNICGFESRSSGGLRLHRYRKDCEKRLAEHAEKICVCFRCQAQCSSAAELKLHVFTCMRTCLICGHVFCRPQYREKHELIKHKKSSTFEGACVQCQQIFTAKKALEEHIIKCVLPDGIKVAEEQVKSPTLPPPHCSDIELRGQAVQLTTKLGKLLEPKELIGVPRHVLEAVVEELKKQIQLLESNM